MAKPWEVEIPYYYMTGSCNDPSVPQTTTFKLITEFTGAESGEVVTQCKRYLELLRQMVGDCRGDDPLPTTLTLCPACSAPVYPKG